MPTKKKSAKKPSPKPEVLGPDGKPYRKSKAWVRPELLKVHIVGEPTCGKSSFVAALGTLGLDEIDPFFIPTQPGLECLDVNCPVEDCPECEGSAKGCFNCEKPPGPGRVRKIIGNYEDAQIWINWAIQSPHNPIVIDPVAPLLDYCLQHAEDMTGKRVEEQSYTIWFRARQEACKLLGPITYYGKGLYFISHMQWRERIMGKQTITIAESNIGKGKMAGYINGIMDIEMYFDIDGSDKWIAHIKPGKANLGGDRTGYLPDKFDRGKNAKEAAKTFMGYFYEL